MEERALTVKSKRGKTIVNELVIDGIRWWLADDVALLVGLDRIDLIGCIGAHMVKYENYKTYVDAFGLFKLNPILQDCELDSSLTKTLLRRKSFDYKTSEFRKIIGQIRSCRNEFDNLSADLSLCDRAQCDIYHDFELTGKLDADKLKKVLELRRNRKNMMKVFDIMNKYFDDVNLEALESELCKYKQLADKKVYNRRLTNQDEEDLNCKINNLK